MGRAAARLAPLLEATDRDSVLHGDAHPGNVIVGPEGPLWLDFEEVCRGSAAWDYATIGDPHVIPADLADVAAGFGKLRTLQVAICLLGLVFIFRSFPETKGKTLEQIERSWH